MVCVFVFCRVGFCWFLRRRTTERGEGGEVSPKKDWLVCLRAARRRRRHSQFLGESEFFNPSLRPLCAVDSAFCSGWVLLDTHTKAHLGVRGGEGEDREGEGAGERGRERRRSKKSWREGSAAKLPLHWAFRPNLTAQPALARAPLAFVWVSRIFFGRLMREK